MVRCDECERLIDSDDDPDCFIDTSPTTTICLCQWCRKKDETKPDPRDPDYSRTGIFVTHNCSRCSDGALPCKSGNPNRCEYPHARND